MNTGIDRQMFLCAKPYNTKYMRSNVAMDKKMSESVPQVFRIKPKETVSFGEEHKWHEHLFGKHFKQHGRRGPLPAYLRDSKLKE